MTALPATTTNEDRIRTIAYELWEAEGYPEGQAEEHWHRACALAAGEAEAAKLAPDWLKRESTAPEKPTQKSDISQTLEQMAKRIASRSAA